MAKNRKPTQPAQGGIRRRRVRQPSMNASSDSSSTVKYSALGSSLVTDVNGESNYRRLYVPGRTTGLTNSVGPSIVGKYSTGKFTNGTHTRWEPSVSFTTSGRVYVGFTDNPEVMETINGLSGTTFNTAVKGLGDVVSFPVWQETDVPVPMKLRRKMFDTNEVLGTVDANVLDRSAQIGIFVAVDGAPINTTLGSMWFNDVVVVEGLHSILT
nr:hypothetical protein [Tolivirales sp.]